MASSYKKRHRSEEEARNAINAVRVLDENDLCDPTKSTQLPYLGLGEPCSRPAADLNFVGKRTVFDLIRHWDDPDVGSSVIYGAKGVGKSTQFRAAACILMKGFSALQPARPRERLVFLSAERLLIDFVTAIKDALLFTFLVDDVVGCGNWQEVRATISALDSTLEVVNFIKQRKSQTTPEVFYFFVDGGEQFDPLDYFMRSTYNSSRRSTAADQLNNILVTSSRIWWCASPKAAIVHTKAENVSVVHLHSAFGREEYRTYASRNFLSQLPDFRFRSIKHLTGLVPLFLEAFCDCCKEFAMESLEPQIEALRKQTSVSFRTRTAAAGNLRPTDDHIALLLEEDDNWDAVSRSFFKHEQMLLVRKKAETIVLEGECTSDRDMAKLDPMYVLNAQLGTFCSASIKRLYMEQVRLKEDELNPHADGAWMAYARRLVKETVINWSTLGNLCEDVLASVIQKKGVILGELAVLGKAITLRPFEDVPVCSIQDLSNLKANSGHYYKPLDVSFPFVDAVVLWVDERGILHIIALQFTVNIDNHLKSADQFMNAGLLERWFPDILRYVNPGRSSGTGSSGSSVELHFAFLGCCSKPGYSCGGRASTLKRSRSGLMSGRPPYQLHIQPFDDKCLPGLHAEDYKALLEIAARRTWNKAYKNVCKEGKALTSWTRAKIEKFAKKEFGIADPSRLKFRNKGLLINEMFKVNPRLLRDIQ